jgi:hypothetical protein
MARAMKAKADGTCVCRSKICRLMIAAACSLFQDTNIKTLTPDRQKARTRGLQQRANDAGDFLQSQVFKKSSRESILDCAVMPE